MQGYEIRSLIEVVRQMSDYDLSLYPYLQAYVTTASSEAMWYGKGENLVSFESKSITMPDGKKMNDHGTTGPRTPVGDAMHVPGTGEEAAGGQHQRAVHRAPAGRDV